MPKNYTDINSAVIDQWVRDGWEWGQEISHETYLRAKQGDWSVLLTPTKPVPKEWFCPMQGAKILGLASGGGQQIPIFTALGAQCTVLDYSQEQLQLLCQGAAAHLERVLPGAQKGRHPAGGVGQRHQLPV